MFNKPPNSSSIPPMPWKAGNKPTRSDRHPSLPSSTLRTSQQYQSGDKWQICGEALLHRISRKDSLGIPNSWSIYDQPPTIFCPITRETFNSSFLLSYDSRPSYSGKRTKREDKIKALLFAWGLRRISVSIFRFRHFFEISWSMMCKN